jgi:predicted ribosomally synthesized peptide with SipW-like signal peptide
MTKILKSAAVIAFVAAIAVGATSAFFSDEEKSVGNSFTAGTIDISVDGQNPWVKSWHNLLDKPSQTNYMNFTIKNDGKNPANVWKKLTVTSEGGGDNSYCSISSSEPEYTEGGGTVSYNGTTLKCGGSYVERADLSSYMVYDMSICKLGVNNNTCSLTGDEGNQNPVAGTGWEVLIDEAHEVRVDNVNNIWIKLTEDLKPDKQLLVSQSYHLKAWNDANEPEITNWAQGDVMTFDITLEARQMTAPAPNGAQMGTLILDNKNTTTWDPITSDTTSGTLTYNTSGNTFNFTLSATGLIATGQYRLIYYPDPWAATKTVYPIGSTMTASSGSITQSQNVELTMNLPKDNTDNNFPVGAKIWLVPESSLSGTTLSWVNTDKFLFEMNLISYTDN